MIIHSGHTGFAVMAVSLHPVAPFGPPAGLDGSCPLLRRRRYSRCDGHQVLRDLVSKRGGRRSRLRRSTSIPNCYDFA